MKRSAVTALLMLTCFFVSAQKQRNNWFFGTNAAISFSSGMAQTSADNPKNFALGTACISDSSTGRLLFYSNGATVWSADHNVMANGANLSPQPSGDVSIFPVLGSNTNYFMFFMNGSRLEYVLIDMSRNNGRGEVIKRPVIVSQKRMNQYVVIRHKYADGYWVVTADSRDGLIYKSGFESFYIDSSGLAPKSVSSDIQTSSPVEGDMVATHSGDYLVVATKNYTRPIGFGIPDNMIIKSYQFDRLCGTVSEHRTFYELNNRNITSFSAAFSPDDNILYVSCIPLTQATASSYLLQFDHFKTSENYTEISSSVTQQYCFLRTGPDNRIYMTTTGSTGSFVDVIRQPDLPGPGCGYQAQFVSLGNMGPPATMLDLPQYAAGLPPEQNQQGTPFKFTSGCSGSESLFTLNSSLDFDSVHWNFGDGPGIVNARETKHVYASPGKYTVTLITYKCKNAFTYRKTIEVVSAPLIDLPEEVLFCSNKSVTLNGPEAKSYLWSTGAATRTITTAQEGMVWLKAFNDSCMSTDSVRLKHYPDLATILNNEYFICEEQSELARLDAGEGFTNYKWTPTGDTTQWIIVAKSGDYFVLVSDYRGCESSNGTIVKKRCPVAVHFPNVFTPNKDGTNDTYAPHGRNIYSFKMSIYTRWGEKVFETTDLLKTWDGTVNGIHAPDDIYIYQAEYSGYVDKRLHHYTAQGNITLIR